MTDNKKHAELFSEKMVEILRSTFNMNIVAEPKVVELDEIPTEDQLYVSIYVTGTMHGEYILALKRDVALKLLDMAGMSGSDDDYVTAGQIFSELLNIVTGITATKLKGARDEATITAPKFVYGHPHYPPIKSHMSRIHINESDYIDCIFYLDEMMLDITSSYRDSLKRLVDSYKRLKTAHEKILNQQKMLVHAEKVVSIGTLSAGVAHNINTPLGTINLSCSHIKNELQKDPIMADPALKSVNRIDQTVNRIANIIKALRSYSQHIAIGEVKDANLNEMMQSFEDKSKDLETPKGKKVKLITSYEGLNNQNMICNDLELLRGLNNLVTNSCEALEGCEENERWVKIEAKCEDDNFVVLVSNGGEKADPNEIEKAFDPFHTTKDPSHPGLGLTLAQGIVEGHGGTLKFDNTCDNTRLKIEIPMSVEESQFEDLENTAA